MNDDHPFPPPSTTFKFGPRKGQPKEKEVKRAEEIRRMTKKQLLVELEDLAPLMGSDWGFDAGDRFDWEMILNEVYNRMYSTEKDF